MTTTVVLFTRDLRVYDNPALHAACRTSDRVLPLFVLDPAIRSSPNRDRFLAESLADLRASLRARGGDLVVRHGDPVAQTLAVATWLGATGVVMAADASGYAARRQHRLAAACASHRMALRLYEGVTVVPPGALRPTGGGSHYRVFTPYWRAWRDRPRRVELPAPRQVRLPDGVWPGADAGTGIGPGPLPGSGSGSGESPRPAPGGEQAGHRRLAAWQRFVAGYAAHNNDLAADRTSRLSPYLHFGCLSPVAVAARLGEPEQFIRQLCWRDFHHQVLADFPGLNRDAYRTGALDEWRVDPDALAAWQSGTTGVPIVDAGMRQLASEGFLPNRARLITAGYLTRILRLDWREGMWWYQRWLTDADIANNAGNWQWVAGTGNDPRPGRGFNPLRQADRFDADGGYVRRWVPELAGIRGPAVHRPWLLPSAKRPSGYPPPLALTRQ